MIKRGYVLSGTALAAAAAMLGSCNRGGAAVVMEPGEWEMTMRFNNVRMDNMPPEMQEEIRRASNSHTTRDCMTVTADVIRIENLRFTIPQYGRSPASCRIAELSMEGGRIRGQLNCDGVPADRAQTLSLSGEMNGTYSANSMDVSARGEVRMGNSNGSAEVQFTGRRIGACPPPPPPYVPPPAVNMPEPMLENDMMPVDNSYLPADNGM